MVPAFRTALITGASSGIGLALAVELARRGTHVVIAARNRPMLENLGAQIQQEGGSCTVLELDVRDASRVREVVQEQDRLLGGLELIVANAGVGRTIPGVVLTYEGAEEMLRVNLLGAIATLCAGLPAMVQRKRGTLVGVSSLAAWRGTPGSAPYCASKAGLSTFLEALRPDLARVGVRVVTVHPGFVRTPMTAPNRFPMPFLLEPEEAARLLVRRLERGDRYIDFPWQMAWLMRLLAALPRGLYAWLAERSPSRME